MPVTKRKVHFFVDCSEHKILDVRNVRMTKDVRECTCSVCKNFILDAIRVADWTTLDENVRVSLTKFAFSLVKTEK